MPLSCRPRVFLFALAALGLGCRDEPTGPRSSLTVSVVVDAPPDEYLAELPDGIKLTCSALLSATATGSGTAHWQDGVLRFYYGRDRAAVADSQPLTPAEVRSAWGDTLVVGSPSRSQWRFWASVPFEVEAEFRYLAQGGAAVPVKTRLTCGPVPGSAVTAPTVTQLSVAPQGELQAGQTFDVTYSATSPAALWSTVVVVDGPFTLRRETAERGVSATTRTVGITVPPGARNGVPITVTVLAVDVGLQVGTRNIMTNSTVVDRTPPRIFQALLLGSYGRIAGQFGVGDNIQPLVEAIDNDLLEWVVWELGPPANVRDSVRFSPRLAYSTWTMPLPVRPEWVGAPTLSLYVRDAAGLKSEVRSSLPDSLRFYPVVARTATLPVTATSATAPNGIVELGDVVFDAKRGVYYVALLRSREVGVLDATTMTYRSPIVVPAEVAGIDLTPGGDSLVVALPSLKSLAIVDLANPTVPTTIALSALDTAGTINSNVTPRPSQVRVAANGKAIVALDNKTASGDALLEVNLRAGTQAIRADARNSVPFGIQLTGPMPDRSRILLPDFVCPRSYLSATDAFTSCGPHLDTQWLTGATFGAAGRIFTLGNAAFDLDYTRLRLASAINGQLPVSALSPDGAYMYLGANQVVAKMRVADGVIVERFAVPVTAQRLLVSPSGAWLYVFQRDYAVRATRVDVR